MKCLLKIEILLLTFITFIVIFTMLYKNADPTFSYPDALYLAVSYQTFTGASSIEDNKSIRNIATVQMLISYILVAIVSYSLIQT